MIRKEFNIYCWNANSISNKFEEIILALYINKIDILAINDTKLNELEEKNFFDNNYSCIFKSRNKHGGGVGFLIKKDIEFSIITDLNKFEKECICIKIINKEKDFYLITYYNPPNCILSYEMLDFINKNYKNYIICGDLNAKAIEFGCVNSNKNGEILCDFVINSRAVILNDKEPTFFRNYAGYSEILVVVVVVVVVIAVMVRKPLSVLLGTLSQPIRLIAVHQARNI